jgi:pyruvate/2-oxoglutarate dehydrogenase complex dihydrolipoamide acyltransferase (E2) component
VDGCLCASLTRSCVDAHRNPDARAFPDHGGGQACPLGRQRGDEIKAGDVIAEIETDKATMEVEAVDEGRLGKILIGEGTEGVKVNTPIAVILAEGEDASSMNGSAGAKTASAAAGGGRPGAFDANAVPEERR